MSCSRRCSRSWREGERRGGTIRAILHSVAVYQCVTESEAGHGPPALPVLIRLQDSQNGHYMAKPSRNNRPQRPAAAPTPFEESRDELFQHIMQCGVVGSEPQDQKAWFDETMVYLKQRFPELSETELGQLRTLGERFSQPPKAHQQQTTAA